MIKITRLTDYGIMLLANFAKDAQHPMRNARDLGAQAHLPLPTVSKILKVLARKGLLKAHRGAKGGFSLARRPQEITVAQIVDAVEGHMGITECSFTAPGTCILEENCPVQNNWQRISRAVWGALENITLAEMAKPLQFEFGHHRDASEFSPHPAPPYPPHFVERGNTNGPLPLHQGGEVVRPGQTRTDKGGGEKVVNP